MNHSSDRKNWGKYYIYILFLLPAGETIILNLPYPSWILRFVAVAYFFGLPTVGFLVIGLNPFTDCYLDSRAIRSGDEKKPRAAIFSGRVFTILLGLMGLYISVPIAKDATVLVKNGINSLIPIEAEVVESDSGRSTVFLKQNPVLQVVGSKNTTNGYYLYFCRQWLSTGQIYKFFVTPNAKLILALQRIK